MKKISNILMIVFVVCLLNGCDEWDDLVDSVGGSDDDDTTATTTTSTTKTTSSSSETKSDTKSDSDSDSSDSSSKSTTSKKFDHYNPNAWKGTGSALVLCKGEARMKSCSINGTTMQLHGSQDKGRDVWTVYRKKGLSGTITCKRGSDSFSYKVSGSGMTNGSCSK